MSLVYNEEQQQLDDSAREFLAARSPVAEQRRIRDEDIETGFDPKVWAEMLDLGWGGIALSEQYGGLEFGFQGFAPVFDHIGRQLSASPLLSSVVLCGSLIELQGAEDQKQALLPGLISGEFRMALSIHEQDRFRVDDVGASAAIDGDELVINAENLWVPDGKLANSWLVACRLEEGKDRPLVVVHVPSDTANVTAQSLELIDSRNHASLTLKDVRLPKSAMLGEGEGEGDATAAVEIALDKAAACVSAELLGASQAMFDMTLEYLKTRVQFGQPIGSFQALQHRASWLYVDLELARSAIMAAFEILDNSQANTIDRKQLVSLAKWKAGETAHKVSSESVQMHGGIGVTDEYDLGLYLKRVRVAETTLGDRDFHCERYAETVKYKASERSAITRGGQ